MPSHLQAKSGGEQYLSDNYTLGELLTELTVIEILNKTLTKVTDFKYFM